MRILPLSLVLALMSLTFCAQKEAPKAVAEIPTTPPTIPPVVTDTAKKLVWSDEFNTDGLPDPAKWGYDLGAGGWGNNELENYTNRPENAVVAGGVLKITAIKENYLGSSYTSARMLTKDKYSFKYGKVEVKAKMPSGVGTCQPSGCWGVISAR